MDEKEFKQKVLDEMRNILKEKKNSSKKIEDLIDKERSFLNRTNAGDIMYISVDCGENLNEEWEENSKI